MIRQPERANREIIATFCIKICMIQFLKDRMSSISSDLYEEILKPNKIHTNRITQIVPCKTALRVTFLQNTRGLFLLEMPCRIVVVIYPAA